MGDDPRTAVWCGAIAGDRIALRVHSTEWSRPRSLRHGSRQPPPRIAWCSRSPEADGAQHDWSPDDTRLLATEAISINQTNLWLVETGSGSARTLLAPAPGDTVAYGTVRFSRDGKGVYLTSDSGSEFLRLGYLDLGTKAVTWLSSDIPWDVESFALSRDGRRLAFTTNEAGISRLHLLDTRTRRHRPRKEFRPASSALSSGIATTGTSPSPPAAYRPREMSTRLMPVPAG